MKKVMEVARDLKQIVGKVRVEFLPSEAEFEIARAFEFGANKYPPGWTWRHTREGWREIYGGAAKRHIMLWLDPTVLDFDVDINKDGVDVGSGLSHLAHAGCNIMICLWHELRERRGTHEKAESDPPQPPLLPPLVQPTVTGQPTEEMSIVRVYLSAEGVPESWNTETVVDYFGADIGTVILVDGATRRAVFFECPRSVEYGDTIRISMNGEQHTFSVQWVDNDQGSIGAIGVTS